MSGAVPFPRFPNVSVMNHKPQNHGRVFVQVVTATVNGRQTRMRRRVRVRLWARNWREKKPSGRQSKISGLRVRAPAVWGTATKRDLQPKHANNTAFVVLSLWCGDHTWNAIVAMHTDKRRFKEHHGNWKFKCVWCWSCRWCRRWCCRHSTCRWQNAGSRPSSGHVPGH